jgi:hypothetical protein
LKHSVTANVFTRDNKLTENVMKYRYMEIGVRDETYIHEEVKGKLNSGIACYHSV